jgi:hypothetical protein
MFPFNSRYGSEISVKPHVGGSNEKEDDGMDPGFSSIYIISRWHNDMKELYSQIILCTEATILVPTLVS